MTALVIIMASVAYSEPISDFPATPPPSTNECPLSVGLTKGSQLPEGLLNEDSRLSCSAILIPTSDAAHLLQVESWATDVASLHQFQIQDKWWGTPKAQRWIGRVEVALLATLSVGIGVSIARQ